MLAATTLRNVLGTKNLAEILSEREIISQVMQNALDEATDPWGVKVRSNVAPGHTTPSECGGATFPLTEITQPLIGITATAIVI